MELDDLAGGLILLLNRVRRGTPLTQNDIETLEDFLLFRTLATDVSQAFDPDPANPGYFLRETKRYQLRVPFNIVAGFPNGAVLNAVVEIAESVRMQESSCICIGGSTTFLGELPVVGDLDYCEYVDFGESASEGLAEALSRIVAADFAGREIVVLCKIKCGPNVVNFPWPDQWRDWLVASLGGAPPDRIAHRIKLDFCAVSENLGCLPASNIVLPMELGHTEGGNAEDSFAYQEAIIDFGGREPRGLMQAANFLRYVNFLYAQATDKLEADPIKALKRLLSLYRALGLSLFDENALQILNSPEAASLVRWRRLSELSELAVYGGHHARVKVESAMRVEASDALRPPNDLISAAEEGARRLARAMLGYFETGVEPRVSSEGGRSDPE